MTQVDIPKIIDNRPGDYVAYEVLRPGAKEKVKNENAPCYANEMREIRKTEFLLKPQANAAPPDSFLPPQYYKQWVDLGRAAGVVPDGVEAYSRRRLNYMRVPAAGYDRHTIYATLCWYRWTENFAKFPYTVCRLTNENPGLDFWQVFHYAALKHVTISNHSFTSICAGGAYGSYARPSYRNLMRSYTLKLFFRRDEKGNCPAKKYDDGNPACYTNNAIEKFSLAKKLPTDEGYIRPEIARPAFCVDTAEDLLWEEWAGLYQSGLDDPKELGDLYSAIIARRQPAKAA